MTEIHWWLLNRNRFGKKLYAIGANARASHYSGVAVNTVRLSVYMLSGLAAGVAGFMFLSRTGYIAAASGGDMLMTTIASLVVGGISLSGGFGGIKHAISGVLLLAALSNLMNIMLISPYVQNAINGFVILVAVSVYSHIHYDRA